MNEIVKRNKLVLVCVWSTSSDQYKFASRFVDEVIADNVQIVFYGNMKEEFRKYFLNRGIVYSEIDDPRGHQDLFDYIVTIGLGVDINERNKALSESNIVLSLMKP